MKSLASVVALCGLSVLGCDGPSATGPRAPELSAFHADVALDGSSSLVTVTQRTVPLANDLTASLTITRQSSRKGGYFGIPDAGIWVVFPGGGVLPPGMTLTVTALKGDMLAYEFGPHGTTFSAPLTLYQQVEGPHGVKLVSGLDAANFQAGYFPDQSSLIEQADLAFVREKLPVHVDYVNRYIMWDVSHFSGYLVASGSTR